MTQRDRILAAFRANPAGVTSSQFLHMHMPRYSARILELRAEGWQITTKRVRNGLWVFTLVSEPARPGPENPPAPEVIHDRGDRVPDARLFAMEERRPLGAYEDAA